MYFFLQSSYKCCMRCTRNWINYINNITTETSKEQGTKYKR